MKPVKTYRLWIRTEALIYVIAPIILAFVLGIRSDVLALLALAAGFCVLQLIVGVVRFFADSRFGDKRRLKSWLWMWIFTVVVWGVTYVAGELLPRPSVLFFGDGRVPGTHWFEWIVLLGTPVWLFVLYIRYLEILNTEAIRNRNREDLKRGTPPWNGLRKGRRP